MDMRREEDGERASELTYDIGLPSSREVAVLYDAIPARYQRTLCVGE